jgi:predicted ATPase
VLRGLWNYHLISAEFQSAHALSEQLLTLAQQLQDSALLVAAHRALGTTVFCLAIPTAALTQLTQGMTLYTPQQHRAAVFRQGEDSGVICHIYAACTLWVLGYPDQGLARSQEAVTLARQSTHPFSLGFVLCIAAFCHQLRREGRATQERAEAAMRLAQDQGFPYWMAQGASLRGWALAHQEHAQEGITQLHQGLTAHRATGAELVLPYFLALLAETQGTMGQPEAGLAVVSEALTHADKTGERWYEPELYRLKGALLLHQSSDNQAEAEHCFQQSLDIARQQQAKSWELRTATSLARLWQQQGKRQDAYELLAPTYTWFTEGFDTADLQDAKALLDALQAPRSASAGGSP